MSEFDRIYQAYRHCEELVRVHDKDHFLASLFAPVDRRSYLSALYAFAFEIARVKVLVNDPMAGTIRLQWWLEAIRGMRAGEAAASPVMIALQDAAHQTNISLMPLSAAVEARQAELYGTPALDAEAIVLVMAAGFLGEHDGAIKVAADLAAQAVTFTTSEPEKARAAYVAFRGEASKLPEHALPAFLTVSLVPIRLNRPDASQWRKQIMLLRTAWFGFPKI